MQYRKIIALYVRLSSEDDDVKRDDYISESRSIKNQKMLLQDFVKSQEDLSQFDVVEYKDDGYSGTNFDRPKFIELMSEVRKGFIEAIVVKDFSRLGRDYLEAGNFLDKIFPAYGVRFIAVNDHYDSNDYIGQTTGLDVGLKNITNEMYSKDLSVKIKSARVTRYKKGEYNFAYPFYGYKKDPVVKGHLLIDEEAAEIVRLIFQCSIEGKSSYETAVFLNEKNVLSPSEYKKSNGIFWNTNALNERTLWDSGRIRSILKDERYLGHMVFNQRESVTVGSSKARSVPKENWIYRNNTHDPIITEDIFEDANTAMKNRMKRNGIKGPMKKRKNLFTCTYCGHKLQYYGGKDNRKYLYCVYGCVNRDQKCKSIRCESEPIKQTVLYTINMIANVYTNMVKKRTKVIAQNIEDADEEMRKLNGRLNELKMKNRAIYMMYAEGEITREVFCQKTENNKNKVKELEHRLKEMTSTTEKEVSEKVENFERVKDFSAILELQEYDEEVLRSVLEAVYVDENGKVELSFKQKDILAELGIA